MDKDERYMQRCLELARQALGRTSPNPLVGSVVVDDNGDVIAEGFHSRAGQPHAEVEALNRAGDNAHGKTLYVNLEPCSHFGRTPPCSERVIASGVRRVVAGMADPNPRVAGSGLAAIAAAGIEVKTGVLEAECRYLNRAFIKWITCGRPWTALKMAATLDGRIADRYRHSRWITGAEARAFVHALRDEYDAVLIGAATAIEDDPELNVRERENSRDPIRVVLDAQLALSPNARLAANRDGKTIVFALASAIADRGRSFAEHIQLVATPAQSNSTAASGPLDLNSVIEYLGKQNITSVLCEGGSRLAASMIEQGLIDELYWLLAPKILCDASAVPVLSGLAERALGDAVELGATTVHQLGRDVLIHGLMQKPG